MSQSANFTRPADTTAYASGDLVANSTTAASVTPLSWVIGSVNRAKGNIMVRKVRIKKSGTTVTNASFRVHLYETSPTVTNGDNGAWLSIMANYMGSFDVTVDKVFSDASQGVGTPSTGSEVVLTSLTGNADKTIYGLVEARAAYTPASEEVFTIVLEMV